MVENERVLGLHADNFLTWKVHVQSIHNTIAGKLAFLCRIKQYLPYKANKTFLQQHMDYCSTLCLWGNATTSDRIYKLKIIADSEYRAPSDPLLEQLNWLPLPERVKYRQSQLVYKAVNGLAPDFNMRCSHRSRPEQHGQMKERTCMSLKHARMFSITPLP